MSSRNVIDIEIPKDVEHFEIPSFIEDTTERYSWIFNKLPNLKSLTYKGKTYKTAMFDCEFEQRNKLRCKMFIYESLEILPLENHPVKDIVIYHGVRWLSHIQDGELITKDCGYVACNAELADGVMQMWIDDITRKSIIYQFRHLWNYRNNWRLNFEK